MRPRLSGFEHRPGLDGLRAVAVVIVVAFHAGALGGGWVGVDVFFVLSGWLITGLLVAEIRTTGSVDVGAFWRRRLRRLLPAIVVTLAFVSVLAVVGALELRRRGVIGALTYTTNWLNITGSQGYWESFAAPDPLRHLWSLAVEEQIYLLWPILVIAVLRVVPTTRRIVSVRVAALIVAAASIAIAVHGALAEWSIDRLYQGTDTRASAFAVGALAAGLAIPRLGDVTRHLIVFAAIALAVVLGSDGGEISLFRGPIHIVTLCGLAAVTAAAGIERGPLCARLVRRLGAWSYGIYLVHYPLTVALEDDLHGVVLAAAVLALSIPLAAASHRLIEQPIRRRGLPGRHLLAGLTIAAGIATAALVVAVPITPLGLESLPSLDAAAPSTSGTDPSEAATAPRRILIVGDSVPALAADEFVAAADEADAVVGVLAKPACIGSPYPEDQYLEVRCSTFIGDLRTEIAAQEPDVVVWWWGGVGARGLWKGETIDVCSLAGFAAAADQVRWQTGLSEPAKTVIVIPPARTDLGLKAAAGAACQGAALRDAAERAGIDVVRLDTFMCPDVRDDCDRIPREDGMHVDGEGATTVARWMFAQPELMTSF